MSGYSPYQPPPYPIDPRFQPGFGPQQFGPVQRPAVVAWYTVYCVFMALLYLFCLGLGALLLAFSGEIADEEMSAPEAMIMGVVCMVISLPLMVLYIAGPLLPRNNVGWIVGCVNIGIGLTSGCTLLPCIFLLINWIHRDTKLYYGMNA